MDAADVTLLAKAGPGDNLQSPAQWNKIKEEANRNATCAGGRVDDAMLPCLLTPHPASTAATSSSFCTTRPVAQLAAPFMTSKLHTPAVEAEPTRFARAPANGADDGV